MDRSVLGITRCLQDALAAGLRLDSHDAHERCAKLLAEPPRIAEEREACPTSEAAVIGGLE